jgi:hypothetical protein
MGSYPLALRAVLGLILVSAVAAYADDSTTLAAAVTQAADATPAPAPKPVISAQPGSPYIVTMADGREARLKVTSVDGPAQRSHFKVVDNDCSEWQGMSCTYNFSIRRFFLALVWTKNPTNPERVGKIVKYGQTGDGADDYQEASMNFQFSAGLSSASKVIMGQGLPKHVIECPDFRWLPGAAKTAPAEATISRWDGEDNSQNPETANNENRSVSGAMGVHMHAIGPNKMEIDRVSYMTEVLAAFDLLNLSPSESLTLTKSGGEICQVGLTSNLVAEITSAYERLETLAPPPAERTDFIVGSSEVLEGYETRGQIEYWLNADKAWQ